MRNIETPPPDEGLTIIEIVAGFSEVIYSATQSTKAKKELKKPLKPATPEGAQPPIPPNSASLRQKPQP